MLGLHQEEKKIASRASGCTRRSRCSGRNLANSDAAYYGAGRLNAATMAVCVQMQCARAPCIWTQLAWQLRPDAAAAAYAFRRRSVMAIALWTQRVSSGRRVSRQMASGRSLPWHHASRRSCQGTTRPDAAAVAYAFRMRSVMATALWTERVFRMLGVKAGGILTELAMAPCVQMQLSRHNTSGRSCHSISLLDKKCHGNCSLDAARLPDAGCQGRWHPDGACHGTTRPDAAVKAQCVRIQLPRHNPSGRGVSWQLRSGHSASSGCRVSRQMASEWSLPRHHTSRRSCQGIMHPDAAAAAYPFRRRSVIATALWTHCVFRTQGVKADGIRMEPATSPRVQTHLSRQLHMDPVVTALNIAAILLSHPQSRMQVVFGGSRDSDSIQLYSLYQIYSYIRNLRAPSVGT